MEGKMGRFVNWVEISAVASIVISTAIFMGCGDGAGSPTTSSVVFDSGRGTGQYDKMTYAEYKSEIFFVPHIDMKISAIRPQIWYCNGSSGFLAFIRNEHYQPLASETGLVDGGGDMTPLFPNRRLEKDITLKADSTYIIVMSVWTTKSVGIYTTGDRCDGVAGAGHYMLKSAKSNTADHPERGGIAFQLLK
jgi:hypothetical protein